VTTCLETCHRGAMPDTELPKIEDNGTGCAKKVPDFIW
jgi:hypothetical protein